MEAFLWSLARFNEARQKMNSTEGEQTDGRRQPQLGAVIFDGCSSKEKVVRDVTNLLTGRVQEKIRQMVSIVLF